MTKPKKSSLDRFGWSSGELCYINDQGNKVRIGEPDAGMQAIIDKLKAERADVATWKKGDLEIIRRGSGGPLISEEELDRILADRADRIVPAKAGRRYPRRRSPG